MATDYSKWRASPEQVEKFRTKPFDYDDARAKMVARIERTIKQLNGERVGPVGGKDFETLEANGVVYRPTLNGHPIEAFDTGDEDGFHADRDALKEMLPHFIEDVKGKCFDDLLKLAMESKKPETDKAAPTTNGKKGGAGKYRQSSLPERADKIPHRVPADHAQPHESYTLNKQKTLWRSPEQVAADDERSARRKATIASK